MIDDEDSLASPVSTTARLLFSGDRRRFTSGRFLRQWSSPFVLGLHRHDGVIEWWRAATRHHSSRRTLYESRGRVSDRLRHTLAHRIPAPSDLRGSSRCGGTYSGDRADDVAIDAILKRHNRSRVA